MPRQSNGSYLAPGGTAAVSGQVISSTSFNTLETDIGTEIGNSLDRLGRGAMAAPLNMGGYKISNMSAGVLATDGATVGQIGNVGLVTQQSLLTTNIPSSTTIIYTSGYASPGVGAATYIKLSSAPSTPIAGAQFQTLDGAWWQLASTPIDVRMLGADPTGVADSTAAFNNALLFAAVLQSRVVAPGSYLINGTVSLTLAGNSLQGDGPGVSQLTFGASASACVIMGGQSSQVNGLTFRGFTLNCGARTGGQAIYVDNAAYTFIEDVLINNCYNGVEHFVTNTSTIVDLTIQFCRGAWALYWHASSNGSTNSSDLTLINIVVQCSYSGADGMWWDGYATTLNAFQLTFLGVHKGLWIKNSGESASYFPEFGVFDNFVTDGVSNISLQIDGGAQFDFVNSFIQNTHGASGQGGADTNAVYINGDTSASFTNDINFVNCRLGNCGAQVIVINGARDVSFSRCSLADGSKSGSNTSDCVYIYAPSQDISFVDCKLTVWGTALYFRYGFYVSASTLRIKILGCSISAWNTAPIYWANTDSDSYAEGNLIVGSIAVPSEPRKTTPASQTVTGALTLTSAQMLGGILSLGGSPGAFTATTATAAQLVAACGQPFYLASFDLLFLNTTGAICTLSAGSGVTVVGNLASGTTMAIAASSQRTLKLVITNPTPGSEAVTIYG